MNTVKKNLIIVIATFLFIMAGMAAQAQDKATAVGIAKYILMENDLEDIREMNMMLKETNILKTEV